MSSTWDIAKPFVFGCISGCTATSCIQPLDTIKVGIQIKSEMKGTAKAGEVVNTDALFVAREIYREGGVKGFYKGY